MNAKVILIVVGIIAAVAMIVLTSKSALGNSKTQNPFNEFSLDELASVIMPPDLTNQKPSSNELLDAAKAIQLGKAGIEAGGDIVDTIKDLFKASPEIAAAATAATAVISGIAPAAVTPAIVASTAATTAAAAPGIAAAASTLPPAAAATAIESASAVAAPSLGAMAVAVGAPLLIILYAALTTPAYDDKGPGWDEVTGKYMYQMNAAELADYQSRTELAQYAGGLVGLTEFSEITEA